MGGSKIALIMNPAARGGRAERLRSCLGGLEGRWRCFCTAGAGDARRLAAEAVGLGFETVVAGGGDGTVNEVINGMCDVPGGLEQARLGVLPMGTINVFALELGIARHWERAVSVVERGRERRLDLPRAEFGIGEGRQPRRFVQLAGAGWDARAIANVSAEGKRRMGFWAYVRSGLQALGHSPPNIEVETEGGKQRGAFVGIGNGRFYGGPIVLFPRANPSDGLMDVCVYPRVNAGMLPAILWGVATNRLCHQGGARYLQTKRFELTSAEDAPLQMDGELVGALPARFSIEPQKLRVLAP